MSDTYTVYILTNNNHTVLYTGVTHNIEKRMTEHREKIFPGFNAKYNCCKLLYTELWEDRNSAYHREKQIKRYPRDWKLNLIHSQNPSWIDLGDNFLE